MLFAYKINLTTYKNTVLKLSAAGLLLVFLSIFSTVLKTDTAYAEYPANYCTFGFSGDKKSISATCDDNTSNGSLDGATFKQTSSSVYSYTEAATKFGGKKENCTTKISVSKAGDSATISGKYVVTQVTGGIKGGSMVTASCGDITSKKISIGNGGARTSAYTSAIVSAVQPLVTKSCASKTSPPEVLACQATAKQSIDSCSFAATSFANGQLLLGGEFNKSYQTQMSACLKQKFPGIAAGTVDDLVAKGSAAGDKAASGITDIAGDDSKTPADNVTCAVDGIGWIVCPIMTFMSKLNDAAFGFLNDYLNIRPDLVSDGATQKAWSTFRDIANVMFVIAFMVIVYSQITSAGVSNYGIKKLLPKIVIAAILVNVSLYVCQVLVDVSNIVGGSVYTLLKDSIDVSNIGEHTTWESAVSGALAIAAGAVGIVLLLVLVVIAPMSLLAFGLVILILIARQALVILLVVISPIAFVAYLLPNTEAWFKKWWKALVTTLMVYPIVGLIFGASTLASSILSTAAAGAKDSNILQIMALGVMAVPLFAVPAVLKGSLSAAGSIGNKLAGIADKTQGKAKGQISGYTNDAKNKWNLASANGKLGAAGGLTRRGMRRDFLRSSRESEAKRATGVYAVGQVEKSERLQRAAGGGRAGDPGAAIRAQAFATQQEHKRFDEDVSAHKTTMSSSTNQDLLTMMADTNETVERRAAAAGMVMSRDHRESHLEALAIAHTGRADGGGDEAAMKNIQKQMAHDMKDSPFALGDQSAGALVTGDYGGAKIDDAGNKVVDASGNVVAAQVDPKTELKGRVGNKLSVKSLAGMNPDELKSIHKMVRTGEIKVGSKEHDNLLKTIDDLEKDDLYKGGIKPEAAKLYNELKPGGSFATTINPDGSVRSAHYDDKTVF